MQLGSVLSNGKWLHARTNKEEFVAVKQKRKLWMPPFVYKGRIRTWKK